MVMRKSFDFEYLVIGSGAAGRVGALMAAGAGLRTAVVEAGRWGGNGTGRDANFAMALEFAHSVNLREELRDLGIYSEKWQFNFQEATRKRFELMHKMQQGVRKTFAEAGIECLAGEARFVDGHTVRIEGERVVSAEKILLATGAQPINPGIIGLETTSFLTPENALRLRKVPESLFVIGAGATGCEVAQYFAELGSRVVLIDLAARILPREDEEVGRLLAEHFERRHGIRVLTYARAVRVETLEDGKRVTFIQNGREVAVRVETLVLATGTAPATDLDLEKAGVKILNNNIVVTPYLQTSVKHIFAAGDLVGGKSCQEKSEYESALATANLINRTRNAANYDGFSRRVDTNPRVVAIGRQEDDCLREDLYYRKILVDLAETTASNFRPGVRGFVKILVNKQMKILGATVVAREADLLMQELALAMRHGLDIGTIANTPHISTSWAEALRIGARKI